MTGQEIARTEQPTTELAIRSDQTTWTDHQIATLRQIGVEHAEQGDLEVFFHQVKRTGLDPFARQIYMISRKQWDPRTRTETWKQTIQTGIDGFRLIARRAADATGDVLSYEDTMWCGPDGEWTDVWLRADVAPAAAKVVVIRRNGQRYPAIATLAEYAGWTGQGQERRLTRMWAEKGALMLAKCAEALALRKAFPQDLSGLYTSDEMNATDRGPAQVEPAPVSVPAAPVADGLDGPPGVLEGDYAEVVQDEAPAAVPDAALVEAVNRVLASDSVDDLRATFLATPPPARALPVELEPEYGALLGIPTTTTLGDLTKAAGAYVKAHSLSVDQGVALDPAATATSTAA